MNKMARVRSAKREHLQIQHQREMILEHRWNALWLVHVQQSSLLFGALNPPLHVPDASGTR
jgi:hypothetical protein